MAVVLQDFAVHLALGGSYYDAVQTHDPLSFWLLNELLFTTGARDHGTLGGQGTFGGVVAPGVMGPFPHGGTALGFNGTSGAVSVGDVAAYEFTGAFSVEFLFKTASASAAMGLVGKVDASGRGWGVWMTATGQIQFHAGTATPANVFNAVTTATYANNSWHHVVCTWTGTTAANGVKVYVDGALAAQATAAALTPAAGTASFIMGAYDNGAGGLAGFFNGHLAGVALHSGGVLSAGQITTHYNSTQWTDVTADVLAEHGLSLEYGTSGVGPFDRLANTGALSFTLDNSEFSTVGFIGGYAPFNGNCRLGFTVDIPVRVRLTYGGVTRTRFWGRIATIDPVPGRDGVRHTLVVAHDYMHTIVNTDFREVVPQLGQSDINLILLVLETISPLAQPMAVQADALLEQYTYAFDDIEGGVKVATAINNVLMSGWSRAYVKGDGTFRWLSRLATTSPVIECVLDDTELLDVSVPSISRNAFDRVRTVTHPKYVDSTPTFVLFAHATANTDGQAPLVAAAGGTLVIWGEYRSPSNESMTIGGFNFVDPPASGTDFVANSAANGSGSNLTANVTVTADFFASSVKLTLTNNHATLGAYFTTLQIRGQGIYDLTPVTSQSLTTLDAGTKPITIDLPYQHDATVGVELAELIITERHAVVDPVEQITVDSHLSTKLMEISLDGEPGDLLMISEQMTGLFESLAYIRSVRLELEEGEILTASFGLLPTGVI